MAVPLLVVGGFLGAGKTTLVERAARLLSAEGRRVGIVTNDQAADLVDTGLLASRGFAVGEVSGSCFCCDFPALLAQAETLATSFGADILLAEPVGSCTDLSATIFQPLKDRHASAFRLGRLSVLVDPQRLAALESRRPAERLHPSAAYILRKQLEEADLIVVTKTDTLATAEQNALRASLEAEFPEQEIRFLSALDGTSVAEWLHAALGEGTIGSRILDVDYDTYAEGEAVLGWLNARIDLASPAEPADWRAFGASLMRDLQEAFTARGLPVGHVKLLLSTRDGQLFASLTLTAGRIAYQGEVGRSTEAALVLNARIETSPESLEAIVRTALKAAAGGTIGVTIRTLCSLRPGRPVPTFRYSEAIGSS
jgi:Ni2+-binding GTPase involved in maturation of urease and hydrogenase